MKCDRAKSRPLPLPDKTRDVFARLGVALSKGAETSSVMKKEFANRCIASGIPEPIANYCASLQGSKKSRGLIERALRFVKYAGDTDQLYKDWHTIEKASIDSDKLISLFIVMPDGPINQPFQGIYGYRAIDIGEERRRYGIALEHAKALWAAMKPAKYREFVADAWASSDCQALVSDFRKDEAVFFHGLRALIKVLEQIDPGAKSLTPQWASEDAGKKNYIILASGLNHYLQKPKWEALAGLVNVNCPEVQVCGGALAKAWKRNADKLV